MELAQVRQAKRLEGPATLREILDAAYEESLDFQDRPGIPLKETRIEEDGSWRFDGSAGRLTRRSLAQLCGRLKLPDGGTVPARYVAQCPNDLAAENLNRWIESSGEGDVLVRSCEPPGMGPGVVRAALSGRYGICDHDDVLEALEELVPEELSVSAWSLDDERLTVRLLLNGDHPASLDDPLRVGLHVTNSEIGLGRISITALVTRLVCGNGLVVCVADLGGVRRRHVGRPEESLRGVVSEGMRKTLPEASEAARRFVLLREKPAPKPVEGFVERTARESDLPQGMEKEALAALEGETVYDVINAFTRVAQRLPVTARIDVETAMSRFLKDEMRN